MTYPLEPPLACDLVLKGGITSGVIYPTAVCELAKVYRLHSVGGSSAGAIAAAAAAAAELGRASGGFDRLEQLPVDITADSPAGGSVLFGLFQPQRSTAGLYRTFISVLTGSGWSRWVPQAFLPWALAGAVPGALVVGLGLVAGGLGGWTSVGAGAVLVVVGALSAIAFGAVRTLGRHVPANDLGLCNGMPGAGSAKKRHAPALTPWLHSTLQALAGRADSAPITFGDLDRADIELRVMTTNLTRRQPLAMPWTTAEYFFDPQHFRQLFPESIVAWMEQHPLPLAGSPSERRRSRTVRERMAAHEPSLLPLPAPADLPILVATRMSLSFPLLLSAVPLWAEDYYSVPRRPDGRLDPAVPAPIGVNWFSDGGICSNLPVHFFDHPLPSRPTFAVDLAAFPAWMPKDADERNNSYLPARNLGGQQRRWTELATSGLGAVGGFLMLIVDTARSWVDESHLTMPGYRDRIVTIFHDADEGGINLNMRRSTVAALADRGRGAAGKLVAWFGGPRPGVAAGPGWVNHRWIRFRTATAGVDDWLGGFRSGWEKPTRGAPSYEDQAGPHATAPMPSYKLTVERRAAAGQRTAALLDLTTAWESPPTDAFTYRAPAPRPVLKQTPDEGP